MNAERIYTALLRLYPKSFRQEYGETMSGTFRELRRNSQLSRLRFWLFLLNDACRSASRQHLEAWKSGPKGFALQWVLACALGSLVAGALGSALTWSFSYLYHPYLEGSMFSPWTYGALLGLGLAVVQAIALRPWLRLGAVWILVSAACAAVGLEIAMTAPNLTSPIAYGVVLGGFVAGGQWLVLRTRVRRAGWWVLSSAVALLAGVVSWSVAVKGALRGMNPLTNDALLAQADSRTGGLDFVLRGLFGPASLTEFALWIGVMATAGLVIGAVTAKSVSSILSRAR